MEYTIGHLLQKENGELEQLGVKSYNIIPSKEDVIEVEFEKGKAQYFKVLYLLHRGYNENEFEENSEPDLIIKEINSPI